MTIVVAVAVADGLVLASDSATTQTFPLPNGHLETINIWNSANKIFNLHRALPIGAATWGRAAFDGRSIASHCKDLRAGLMGQDLPGPGAALSDGYTVEDVAERVQSHFTPLYQAAPGGRFGMLIGGYGSGARKPEVWQFDIDESGGRVVQLLAPGEAGILQWGQPEAIARIVDGVSPSLVQALVNLEVDPAMAEAYADAIRAQVGRTIVHQGMPLGEAIDLADFLVEATIQFVRFTPGDAVVGGPVEIAALTRHEGFKWVKRKHYYPAALNPQER